MLNMLHLITNTAVHLHLQQLCSQKQKMVVYFITVQKSTIPLQCHVRMNKTNQNC